MSKKSILFVCPAYHNSFFYRDELRKLGWKADIYLPPGYPEKLLFSEPDIRMPDFRKIKFIGRYLEAIYTPIFFLSIFWRYKFHYYYGGLDFFHFFEKQLGLNKLLGDSFRVHLWLSRLIRRKIIHLPSGYREEEMPEIIGKYGDEEEGLTGRDPYKMKIFFDVVRRYSDMNIGYGFLDSSQYRATHIKYAAIDLDIWRPDIKVPSEFQLPKTKNLRIFHSFMFSKERIDRDKGNVKGTKYIIEAMERLKEEGYNVEYMFFDNVDSKLFRYYQVQADIVVEELLRGFGSTAVECLALGKPVITHIWPEWEKFYCKCFPEACPMPIIIANKFTIYSVLKHAVVDAEFRRDKGIESRIWAEKHLNPAINAKLFADLIEKL